MTLSDHIVRSEARVRGDRLARRRRVSIEELARAYNEHKAGTARVGLAGELIMGDTFYDTVLLNRPFLDLYEGQVVVERRPLARRMIP